MAAIEDIVLQIGLLGKWIQAVGLVVILWIIFQAITTYYNRKRRLLLIDINQRLKKLENKINKLINNS